MEKRISNLIWALCIIALALLLVSVATAASNVTFEWDANSENDLAGYRLYQSNRSGVYNQSPISVIPAGTETVVVQDIPDGTYFWVLTAFDNGGNESNRSNEVTKSLDSVPPSAPTQLLIRIVVQVTVN
jgi:fibronectin type 3 domain-containing protein